jgi:hypothetical protein
LAGGSYQAKNIITNSNGIIDGSAFSLDTSRRFEKW